MQPERPLLVLLHHGREAHHVVGQDCGETAGGQFWETCWARPTAYKARRMGVPAEPSAYKLLRPC